MFVFLRKDKIMQNDIQWNQPIYICFALLNYTGGLLFLLQTSVNSYRTPKIKKNPTAVPLKRLTVKSKQATANIGIQLIQYL